MTVRPHGTIIALVLDFIHRHDGKVDYDQLEAAVLKHFPSSAFKKSHWAWYRNQCLKGRFADKFDESEKANLRRTIGSARRRDESEHDDPRAVSITPQVLKATRRVAEAAKAYESAIGGNRKMGITGEVGEVIVCHQLGLRLCLAPQSKGFDAVDDKGCRVQIKTRRSESDGLPRDVGRVSTFSKHAFDYVILAILASDYRLAELWRADYQDIVPVIERQTRRNPSLSAFKRVARCIWRAKES